MSVEAGVCHLLPPKARVLATIDILQLVVYAVARLAAIAAVGYIVFRFGLLRWAAHDLMSKTVLYVTLPALLFTKLAMANSLLERYGRWYLLPISAALLYAMGGVLGAISSRLFLPAGRKRSVNFVMCTFHNAGYLPLVIVRSVFPEYPDLDVLVMIYVLGASPLLWSISPAVLAGGRDGRVNLWRAVNPPIVALLLGFPAMMLGFGEWLETFQVGGLNLKHYALAPLNLLGELSVPLVLLTLGGTLAKLPLRRPTNPRLVSSVIGAKLIVLPILALLIIPGLNFGMALMIVMLVGSMQPPALNLMVQAQEFADEETAESISEGLLYTYLSCLLTLTVFLTIVKAMVT